jgi:hypothetical protein
VYPRSVGDERLGIARSSSWSPASASSRRAGSAAT